jgi:hypothetical protein
LENAELNRIAMNCVLAGVLCVGVLPANAEADDRIPGRFVSISLGVSGNPSTGNATASPPGILQVAPELQLSWGLQLAGQVIVFTRLDFFGTMIPIGPSGYGVDIGVAWTSALKPNAWGPLVRFTGGGLFFGSGGEVSGPDYQAYGFRLALEAGVARGSIRGEGILVWSVLAGVHATGLPHVEPCGPADVCSDVFIGPTLRAEVAWLF